MTDSRASAGFAAGMIAVVLWASAFVGIRAAGRDLAPGPLSLGRLTVALVVLLVVGLARREPLPPRADLRAAGPVLLVCGVLWFGVYNLALNAGERRVDAGTASMIVNVAPVLTAILAGVFLREGFPRALFAGCAIAFAGVSVIGLASASQQATTVGVLLCLLAAATYASGVVTQKVVLRRLTGHQTITLCSVIGVVVLLPFAGALVDELGPASTGAIAWMLYLGVFPTAVGFLAWAFALSRADAGRVGTLAFLVPPVSVVLGWAMLGETPEELALVGGALCLAGVAVARELWPRRRAAQGLPAAAESP
jgi:drug/metabolite transporter (DMT)-like permease